MVFQKPNPFPAMSIYDNVVAGLRPHRQQGSAAGARRPGRELPGPGRAVERGAEPARQPGGALSGGQQQRLCIARSLAVEPGVLLMDEPCSALDPTSTRRIEETIGELAHEVTIVIVTHNMQQAAGVPAVRVLPRRAGNSGRHRRVRDDPADLRTSARSAHGGLRQWPVRVVARSRRPSCGGRGEEGGLELESSAARAAADLPDRVAPPGPVRGGERQGSQGDWGAGRESAAPETCLVGLKEVLRDIDALETRVGGRPGDNRWGWQLLLEGTRVAVSGHGFDRRLRCDMSAARFIEIAPYAEVRSGLAITTGRTWRSRVREEKLAQRSPHMSSPRVPNR